MGTTDVPSATKAAQVRLSRVTPARCRVVLDNPPLNLMGPEFVLQIREIVTALENDDRVKVVVFESAVDGFFLNHSDFLAAQERIKALLERGLQKPGDSENRLGFYVGQLGLGGGPATEPERTLSQFGRPGCWPGRGR
jgi:enoyl-CoA hydratase/carnithine racemase